MAKRHGAALILVLLCWMAAPSAAQNLRRDTIWDLKIGAPVAEPARV